MANLKNTTISDINFLILPHGSTSERPNSPSEGDIFFNIDADKFEVFAGSDWTIASGLPLLGTQERPAPSGYIIAQQRPNAASGYYWIKNEKMPNPLQMYVDMVEEGGGFDFYPIQGGTSVRRITQTNSGAALGLDLMYPRSPAHWRAASNFVLNVLGESGSNYQRYFETTYAVHNTVAGDYVNQIMRNPNFYGSGVNDFRVPDDGRWWLRDSTFGEPNGDYELFGFLGGSSFPEPYNNQDLSFNDSDSSYDTGGYYLVSTNGKP